eukprot:TRINITY_DN1989_c0_g1_i1.p1 TRINITY_DN1989_c0_g1~~TRINITY_DN1989_c0_g1_i1.p1  ORF type:complete len:383 (+),score=57.82 TRINITY_DN1989_c0_g1_i1:39-1151(+)
MRPVLLQVLALCVVICVARVEGKSKAWEKAEEFYTKNGRPVRHTNNWAVLVDTSRFWQNYRHAANVLTMYHLVKKLGIPDSNIILMMGDDIPCNVRNPYPATLFNNQNHSVNLYGNDVEVDYRGYEVTVENFLRVMTGRHEEGVPKSKRLDTDEGSNILVYMSGHGGDEFLKFQDATEITSQDIRDTLWQMWNGMRYHSVLLSIETCQAATMIEGLKVPSVVAIGSSLKDENSYSHHNDFELGVHVIDRFTYYTLEMLHPISRLSSLTLQSVFSNLSPYQLNSHPYWVSTHPVPLDKIRVTDYYSSKSTIAPMPTPTPLTTTPPILHPPLRLTLSHRPKPPSNPLKELTQGSERYLLAGIGFILVMSILM